MTLYAYLQELSPFRVREITRMRIPRIRRLFPLRFCQMRFLVDRARRDLAESANGMLWCVVLRVVRTMHILS